MTRHRSAHILLTALLLLSGLFSLMLLHQEYWFGYNQSLQSVWKTHLTRKMALSMPPSRPMLDQHCQAEKRSPIQREGYQFECEKAGSFFVRMPRSREKYIPFTDIEQVLDVKTYAAAIHPIRTLADLPPSSVDNPKVVRALNPINERLPRHFYGIVITDYPFDITDRWIVGMLYSSYHHYDDQDVRWNRTVFKNLENQLSRWQFLPHSLQYAYDISTYSR
ncbi:MAG: hypothetical protein Q4A60_09825 [Pasteurellaceae bacterium]|nr:hypothetical protein [Pasteurellaceae bacterium]